jgi:hypothetical protein
LVERLVERLVARLLLVAIASRSRLSSVALDLAVIAGEQERSWRAGGQQEGLQYNGEAAW